MQDLAPFFAARHFIDTHSHILYEPLQWGSSIQPATQEHLDWSEAEIVLLGCGERRGHEPGAAYSAAPDAVRKQLYSMFQWHPHIRIADAGNILQGASLDDTRAALRTVLAELHAEGKIVVLIGGSHDLTLSQYEVYRRSEQVVNVTAADMLIDLDETETVTDRSYLMDMVAAEPSFVRHYTHLAFQSYAVNPRMLEMLDKLRFDFTRVGTLRTNLEEAEPSLRATDLFSFDMNCVRYSDAPANSTGSPNGLAGDEACQLARYAGMATHLDQFGIFGYEPEKDIHEMTARLIAQMIWYFVDGCAVRKSEADIARDKDEFVEFHVSFTANDTAFRKSKRTGRWWMQLTDGRFVPCSYNDYLQATNDEIPERWLREGERMV